MDRNAFSELGQRGRMMKQIEEKFKETVSDVSREITDAAKNIAITIAHRSLPPYPGLTISYGQNDYHLILKHADDERSDIVLLKATVDVSDDRNKTKRDTIGVWELDALGNLYDKRDGMNVEGLGWKVLERIHLSLSTRVKGNGIIL